MNCQVIISIKETTTNIINKLASYCNMQHIIMKVEMLDNMYVVDIASKFEDKFIAHMINELKEANANA